MRPDQKILALVCLSMAACGGSDGSSNGPVSPGGYHVGDEVDLDMDGKSDGKAIDTNDDGIADSLDSNGDGKPDSVLPGSTLADTGYGANTDSGINSGSGCSEQVIVTDRLKPDMLVVLDRSTSMQQQNRGIDRWTPSKAAVQTVTTALDKSIRFGLMVFPGTDGGNAQCVPGTLEVPIADDAASAINQKLANMSLDTGTPTAVTLASAHALLGKGGSAGPDQTLAAKYVLLVTDGQPNCTGGSLGGNWANDTAAVQNTVNEIKSMADEGIQTYVIAYGTKNDAQLATALDMMALAGGTGDKTHRPVEDEASLEKEFQDIAGHAVSCDFALDRPAQDASFVLIELDGEQIHVNDKNGWKLGADKQHVSIQGTACDQLKSGDNHTLSVKVTCDVVDPV